MTGNTVTSTGSSTDKAGAVCGTVGVAGQEKTVNGVTHEGGIEVSATVTGNTASSGGTATTAMFGRIGSDGGELAVTGGTYDGTATYANDSYDSNNGKIIISGGTFQTQPSQDAIADGFVTFISGCAMGVDLWAGHIVLKRKEQNPALHLIAATPWPGFARRWNDEWQSQYNDLLRRADLVVNVCDHYHNGVFQQRNVWMCDHSSRVIAYYNGAPGGTKNTIDYARKHNIQVIEP